MFRCMKAVSFTLALAVLSVFGSSCSSNSPANVRFVHAIQDGAAMDINISGKTDFTGVSFLNVQPSQPGYASVPSGNNTIEGLLAGTSMVGFKSTTVTWTNGLDYTVIATGILAGGKDAVILSKPDNNSPPPANNVEFRFIHASPSGPPGGSPTVDIYVQLYPSAGPTGTPAVSGLAYTQASNYIQTAYNPNNVDQFPGYEIFVTPAGSTSPVYIDYPTDPANGAIRTLILTDVQNGTKMSSSFLGLPDLN
jgi:hypothetical protein